MLSVRWSSTGFTPSAALSSTSTPPFPIRRSGTIPFPEDVRPWKDQPFYHLFAENADTEYVAYVSEQNLLPDTSGDPVRHPQVDEVFEHRRQGAYLARRDS